MQTDFQFTTLTLACPQFLCHKPIASYTRNGQKISFCRRCKGIIIRTLVEFDFDLSSPAPASKSNTTTTTTTTSTISVQDWLWHLCDLRLYLELERFRLGFEEMIRHIRRELKRNSNNKYAVVEAKAVPGGEWTDHPLAAYVDGHKNGGGAVADASAAVVTAHHPQTQLDGRGPGPARQECRKRLISVAGARSKVGDGDGRRSRERRGLGTERCA
ncbi:hypothetical protein CSUB01_09122 [Colletotrichum sublineola]|uniref:Uncharacterized protein n=1 Tax=Colletotrichum sublineola TaxID=1173701 RepID=A0A066XWT2_COLSU|nr:hypothetical protein CSUB01_09122 [Colletotrichum sublineola]